MTGVLIASLVGAAVFFGVGLLFARRSELLASLAQGQVQGQGVGLGTGQEVERMRASLLEAQNKHQTELSAGGEQLAQAATKLKSAQEEVTRVKVDNTKNKAKAKTLQAEVSTLTTKLEALEAQAEVSMNEVTSVQAEVENTRTGAAKLESQMDQLNLDADQAKLDITSLQSAVKKTKAEKAELQKRTTRAEKKLADAAQELHHMKAEATKKNETKLKSLEESHNQSAAEARLFVTDLEGQLQSVTGRLEESHRLTTTLRSEMEGMRGKVGEAGIRDQELTTLKRKLHVAEQQQAELSKLRSENAELSALKLAASKPLESKRIKRDAKGTTQNALEVVIQEVAKTAKSNAVVLADKMGLPVVAAGEHGYELAAYASLVSELANRTKTFVPVAHPDHIEFVDKNGTTITVWPFQAASENLSLVTLSTKGGAQGVASVRGAVADVAEILNEENQATN